MDQIALDADRLLGGSPDSALVIDESSLPKKGKKSVGVARQWCGRLGKVDNCQVGVYASLVLGSSVTLADYRLYLPQEWIDDRKRCKSAGVPDEITFKSKSQLALDIVHHARSIGIRYAWVGVDGGYGKEPQFLKTLDDQGEQFVADVHKNQSIYLEDPCPYIPEKQGAKGTASMDHYQVRGWLAWHHHMTMVMMSMLFLLETRTEQKDSYPLLRCPDIAALLVHFLPRRDTTQEEIFRQMSVRHRQSQASIDSAYKRQGIGNVTK